MKLFDFLKKIVDGDKDVIDKLTEDELKEFNPYLIQLWVSGANINNDLHCLYTNEIVNKYIFSLSKHKKLLYKLFCIGNNTETYTRFSFPKKPKNNYPTILSAISNYYEITDSEALDYLKILDKESIIEIADSLGLDDKEYKELLGEIKTYYK